MTMLASIDRRFRHTLLAAAALAGFLVPSPAAASPSTDLTALIADHWQWWLAHNPVTATSLGDRRFDDRIGDISLARQDYDAADARAFLKRLAAIDDAGLTPAERTNKAVLAKMLDEQAQLVRHGQRMMLFTSYASWYQNFAGLADGLPFRARADYDSYLKRLALFPAMDREGIAITRQAVAAGYAQPCVTTAGLERSARGVIVDKPEESRFYAPFLGQRPADMSEADWSAAKARARQLIVAVLDPEYRALADYFATDYVPKCRKSVGISDTPGGAAYYAWRAKVETTTDMAPEAIHQLGLSEVARIRTEMDSVAKTAGFADRARFIAALRSDPKYYAGSPQALMAAAALTAKTIDGKMPGLFGRLPRLSYGVRAIPAEIAEGTTTAYYSAGSPDSGIAGTYYVNTSKLDQRPLWELPALTLHEAVPGHHHQIALQQELDLPDFRKHAAFFTAFTEGWALYAERLGLEIGLYDTPEKQMGRLSYEMWRACRLVVDTGIHAKGWSKAQAVTFMRDNTALTDANIDAEVNRYISWPGQALGYKIGEIRIRALRAKAEAALGPKFDLRRFHDAVLAQGSVPMDVLARQVDGWIADEAKR